MFTQAPVVSGNYADSAKPEIAGWTREVAPDPVEIRPLRPEDRSELQRWFATVSMESRYARFLGYVTELTPAQWRYLTEVDGHDHVAFLAFFEGRLAGVARWIREVEEPDTAEIAFLIGDDLQRRGIGARLCARLVDAAHAHGVQRFRAYVMPDNRGIRRLLAAPAFEGMRDRGGLVEVALRRAVVEAPAAA